MNLGDTQNIQATPAPLFLPPQNKGERVVKGEILIRVQIPKPYRYHWHNKQYKKNTDRHKSQRRDHHEHLWILIIKETDESLWKKRMGWEKEGEGGRGWVLRAWFKLITHHSSSSDSIKPTEISRPAAACWSELIFIYLFIY